MINNELMPVTIIKYTEDTDIYGVRNTIESSRTISEAVIKPYAHENTNDARFIDCTMILLFRNCELSYGDEIEISGYQHSILYIQKDKRMTQVFVK